MKITNSNGMIINSKDVDLHDDILKKLSFEREKRIIELLIKREIIAHQMYSIYFVGVLGFQMTACDFWGKSPHILDFEYIDQNEQTLLYNLKYMKNQSPTNPNCKLTEDKDYIETVMTFGSGDKLTVVCEAIIIGKTGDGSLS